MEAADLVDAQRDEWFRSIADRRRVGGGVRPGQDQLAMVAQLATSGAGVQCVEAAPGTGKTTALGVYVAACSAAGAPVVGCAPSARARDELRLGARIERCQTVDKLLLKLRRSSPEPGSVVIVDESRMAGSRKLGRLLDAAEASGAQVVLVGDTKQHSSVDAGGGFRGLIARLGACELVENRRQVEEWEREALRDLPEGRVRQSMTAYAARERLRMGEHGELGAASAACARCRSTTPFNNLYEIRPSYRCR